MNLILKLAIQGQGIMTENVGLEVEKNIKTMTALVLEVLFHPQQHLLRGLQNL